MKAQSASQLLIIFSLVLIECIPSRAADTKITVGPNIRVSATNVRQAEPFIATDPTDSNTLIISTSEVAEGLKSHGMLVQSYVSRDGGHAWSVSELPGMREAAQSGKLETELDNWIAFTPNGDVFLTSLPFTAEGNSPIYVFRSTDKGRTWNDPTVLADAGYDQPKTTTTLWDGKLRIYIAASSRGVVLLSSDDNGQSFTTMGRIGPDNLEHQAMNPLVLANGSVLLPYADFPDPDRHRLNFSRIYVARSEDGGRTFSVPRFVADLSRPYPGCVRFATDLSAGKFRGNVYASWNDGDFGPRLVKRGAERVREESGNRREVAVARSSDGGMTWSAPANLRIEGRGASDLATLAVSPEGVLGVLWLQDERYESNSRCYRVWFAASVDGGDTFSSPASVSDKPSCSDAKLNPEPFFTSRLKGGDYIGLAAAVDGTFHAAWIDARDGAFRLYTARVDVRR